MVSQAELEIAIYAKVGDIQTLFVSDVSGGCGQAYDVVIVSNQFEGKSTLQRHRLVNDRLKEEIASMHAFSQKTYTPKQFEDLRSKVARQVPASAPAAAAAPASAIRTEDVAPPSALAPAPSLTTGPPLGDTARSSPRLSASTAHPATPVRAPAITIPTSQESTDSVMVPELTLTPVTSSRPSLRSSRSSSSNSVPVPSSTIPCEASRISRSHYSQIANPAFWLHLRQLLEQECMGVSKETLSNDRASGPGDAEVEALFEDFFLSQKDYLTANDIARIRDGTGMFGMSG